MTTDELIKTANNNADRSEKKYQDLQDEFGFKQGIREWNEISKNYSNCAEFRGVICESTCCYKGHTQFFQNRFYVRKDDGRRGTFSKAKAKAKLG